MNFTDQGYSGYYDATAPQDSTVGMGDFSAFFRELGGGGDTGPKFARVTTKDAPPDGDIKVRSGPSTSYPQVGGAEKDGVVTILDVSDDGGWYQIEWGGGQRRAAVQGWASAQFLTITDAPPQPGPSVPVVPGGGFLPAPSAPAPTPGPFTPAAATEGPSRGLLIAGGVAALAAAWYFLK